MKNASTLLKKYIKTGGAFYAYAVVTLSTGEKLTLTSDRDFMISPNNYTEQGGSDGFPLGVAVSKTITLTIDNIDERYSKYDFYYARIALYTEADIDYQTLRDINNDVIKDVENDPILTFEPHIERMQEGVFTVLNPVAIGDVIELTAYDDMWKSDRAFSTQLTYPTTALQLLQEVCTSCGMVLGSPTFRNSDFSISSAPEKTTGRKIIGYIAQLACGNAVIQNGMLTIKTHDFSAFSGITDSTKPESLKEDSGYHIFEDFASDPDIDTDNVVITGISTEVESETAGEAETVISGTDDYCIKITNPLIKGKEQTVVNSIGEILVGVTLRKFSGDFFPNPTVEFMDLACVVDRKDKVYRTIVTTHEFSYLGGSSFKCDINSPERQAGEYYSEAAEIYNGIKKDVASNKNNISNMQNAIELLNTTLENAAGMYESNAKQPDGSVVSFIHDKPTLAESKVVIKVTAEAIGLSNDGGKTYPYGIILTGDLIARILYTVGINADYINSGTLTVKDKKGNITFQADTETGVVNINASSFSVNGKTVGDIVEDEKSKIRLSASELSWDSDYSSMTKDGKLTCSAAVLSGSLRCGELAYKWMEMKGGVLSGGYNTSQYGYIDYSATVYDMVDDVYYHGLQVKGGCLRISVEHISTRSSSSTTDTAYIGTTGMMRYISAISDNGDGTITWTESTAWFENGINTTSLT